MSTEQLIPAEPVRPLRLVIELDKDTVDRIQKWHDEGDEFTDTPLQSWCDEEDALGSQILFEVVLALGAKGVLK